MTPRLVAISGPLEGQTFEIAGSPFVLGRHAECDLQLANVEISRRHCETVRANDRHFTLRDLGSRHGTLVNGRAVDEVPLAHSDPMTLGAHSLLFLLDDSAPRRSDTSATGSLPALGASLERRVTETLHLDPARVDAALPVQARLARELHALLRLSTTLQEHREVTPLAARLLDAALEAVPAAERGAVLLREPGLDYPVGLVQKGEGASSPGGPGFERLTDRVLGQGLAICRPCLEDDPELGTEPRFAWIGALVAAPLSLPTARLWA